jgi:phosphoesterase RecJ-like protein
VNDTKEIADLLQLPKEVTIVSHRNPDGDAIGSSIAMAAFLRKQNHNVQVILPSEYPDVFGFLKGIDDIIIYDTEPEKAKEVIEKSSVVICLDFNSLERIDKLGQLIDKANVQIVMIDHHIEPEPFYELAISRADVSSTCELVFNYIKDVDKVNMIDLEIGEAIMTGILTDTGSFRHNTNKGTYYVAGDLKARGVDDYYLQDKIFNSMNEKQLRLLGHCLANRMEIIEEYRTGIISLNLNDYEQFDIQRGDTEGIVNYILMMKQMDVAIFVRQQPKIIKLSLRSKGDISVQAMARDHFGGGGHKNASGGYTYGSIGKVIRKIKEVLPDYVPKI